MVGILLSYWGGLFSGAFAVSFRAGTKNLFILVVTGILDGR